MANSKVQVALQGDNLVITIPFNKQGVPSGSGKSIVFSSTNGNTETDLEIGGKPLMIGVNAYVKK